MARGRGKDKIVAASIEKFLQAQIASGAFSDDQTESLQVALQCIQAVYELEEEGSFLTPNLADVIFPEPLSKVSEDDKKEAERLKVAGNEHVSAGRAALAVECYSKAVALDPTNIVYYSNRAAAYQKDGKYDLAIKDCQKALSLDPSYVKAYTRLGAAYASQGKSAQAIEAYTTALNLDPENAVARAGLDAVQPPKSFPSPSAGGFKMPGGIDLAGLMNNPEMMAMAQQMMNSGALDKMMKDPKMKNMMASMMGGANNMAEEE